jgi:hypothetical protein
VEVFTAQAVERPCAQVGQVRLFQPRHTPMRVALLQRADTLQGFTVLSLFDSLLYDTQLLL